jgi:hypothetical protein
MLYGPSVPLTNERFAAPTRSDRYTMCPRPNAMSLMTDTAILNCATSQAKSDSYMDSCSERTPRQEAEMCESGPDQLVSG